jgi:hypothetical protein
LIKKYLHENKNEIFLRGTKYCIMPTHAKCKGVDLHGKSCRRKVDESCDFCVIHTYMSEYTDKMMNNLTLCKGCLKYVFLENSNSCYGCKDRGSETREKRKNTETIIKCAHEKCSFKRSDINEFCMKHQIHFIKKELEVDGKRLCNQYTRGCRVLLDESYKFIKCPNCLKTEREKDKIRRDSKLSSNNDILLKSDETFVKVCCSCLKTKPINDFVNDKNMNVKSCEDCRNKYKIADSKRNSDHVRELARTNERKTERIEVKNAWKDENYEKCAEYWMISRGRKIEKEGNEYWDNNAKNAKEWRDKNPLHLLTFQTPIFI